MDTNGMYCNMISPQSMLQHSSQGCIESAVMSAASFSTCSPRASILDTYTDYQGENIEPMSHSPPHTTSHTARALAGVTDMYLR